MLIPLLLALAVGVPSPPQAPIAADAAPAGRDAAHDRGRLVGGTTTAGPQRLVFPAQPAQTEFAPFASPAGQPQPADARAAGAADLDGDGNADLWFLAAGGALAVQNARGSSLGRYRDWHVYGAGPWLDGATYRSADYTLGDRIVLVDPTSSTLSSASYTYPFGGNPQAGTFVVNAAWTVGANAYEVETRDDAGDGHDDIGVLQVPVPGWSRIKVLRMGASLGWLQPESEVVCDLPLPALDLRLLDFDADGHSDALVTVPGGGVLLLRDAGARLTPVLWLPFFSGMRGTFCGDTDRDGRDDFGLVFPSGILLAQARAGGFWPLALPAPPATTPLAAACVLGDRQGALTSVVALPADGRSLALFASLGAAGFAAPETRAPASTAAYAGPGARVLPVVADVDGDDDEDLVLPLADRTHWLALRNDERDLAPRGLAVTDLGLLGETGFRKYALVARVPDQALAQGLGRVEAAVFLEDVTLQPKEHVYWGRLLLDVDPATKTVSFFVYSQTEPTKLQSMIQSAVVFPYPDGISAGGDALLSLHVKAGTQRFQSMLVHHDGGLGGQQSALGIRWEVRAAPPKADADTDLLPWN